MGLERAQIYVLKDDLSGHDKKINVMFNPESYSITNGINVGDKKSQISKVDNRTLSFSLFYDTYTNSDSNKNDVRAFTRQITNLVNVSEPIKGNSFTNCIVPKKCRFIWGSLLFVGIFTKVEEKYEMFLPEGIPVRATLNITMKEFIHKKLGSFENEYSKKLDNIDTTGILSQQAAIATGYDEKWRELAKKQKRVNPRPLP